MSGQKFGYQFLILLTAFFIIELSPPTAHSLTLTNENPYYGKSFYQDLGSGLRNQELINTLHTILESRHQSTPGDFDKIGAKCDLTQANCFQHFSIGYNTARKMLMGQISLSSEENRYFIKDVYCEKDFYSDQGGRSGGIGPGKIPSSNILNTEHTWPQSRFTGKAPKEMQKSDLHHLFPADSKMNAIRGNHKFGDVTVPDRALPCANSKAGTASGSREEIFEPPVDHKGNVARALFYFSVRYGIHIDPQEEGFLRKWNRLDPVDQAERDRNDAIFKIQGDRNPFIDHPELSDEISDF